MDPLEIRAEPPEFVANVFHSFSDNGINNENQGYDSSDVIIEQPDLIGNHFTGIDENGHLHGNGHFSSEPTLISVSFVS